MAQALAGNAGTIVGDRDQYRFAFRPCAHDQTGAGRRPVRRFGLAGMDVHLHRVAPGIKRVLDQVDEDLLQTLRIGADEQVGRQFETDAVLVWQTLAQQQQGFFQGFAKQTGSPCTHRFAAVVEQRAHDAPRPLGFVVDLGQPVAQGRARVGGQGVKAVEFFQQNLAGAGNVAQRIVQLVGDAGSQGAQRGELVGLKNLATAQFKFFQHAIQRRRKRNDFTIL